LVAVACFLPGRAKDLSTPWYVFLVLSTNCVDMPILTEVFPCFFLSCKANARVKLAKTGNGPHSTTLVCICIVQMLLFVLSVVICVVLCSACKCVLSPGDNPIAVNKYIIIISYYCQYCFHIPYRLMNLTLNDRMTGSGADSLTD
jgi:hypothetical protein